MVDFYIAVYGGLVALGVFLLTQLIEILKYFREERDAENKMLLIEALTEVPAPLSARELLDRTDLRSGLLRRKSEREMRRLCYQMIREGALRYSRVETAPNELLTRPIIGYVLP